MKTRQFSRQELFDLRNHIHINLVITDILAIPSKWRDGYLRFLCPTCGEFQTATNPKSNLARCFRCRNNFNPIDLVMTDKKIGFVDAVNFLKQYIKPTAPSKRNGAC